MTLTRSELCSIEGNPDLYGLGIRLGIYFQLTSTSLASRLATRRDIEHMGHEQYIPSGRLCRSI